MLKVDAVKDAVPDPLGAIRADDPAGTKPILIAGATASGKSALALRIAGTLGGVIVNADALQVWSCWQILSARPTASDVAGVPHLLYGHHAPGDGYSVGHWLREVSDVITRRGRPIIVGGTGLYLSALTEGLAAIPAIPADVRAEADALLAMRGPEVMLAEIDADTAQRIDRLNPARIQRAWEVQRATGRGLASWQAETGAPIIAPETATLIVLEAERDWLAARIDARFDMMIAAGALDEVAAMLPIWDDRAVWARAIGARELVAHLQDQTDLATAVTLAKAQSRQYAKRQRTWFRARMRAWHHVRVPLVA